MSKSLVRKLGKREDSAKADEFIKFPKKLPFTQKERIVFHGLVKFPELNDQKLSKKLKVKRPTVTAIRNKLRRRNLYSPYVIPNFGLLGYELMTFIWGKSSFPVPLEEQMKVPEIKKAMESPEIVFQIVTDNEFFSFLIFKNFTAFKKMQDGFVEVYKKYSGNESNVHIVHFPFETSKVSSLFDYSLLLKNLFELKFEEKKAALKPKTLIGLREREKLVLGALVKYPGLKDSEIAKKIAITRQTVSKIKSKLMKQRALKFVNEPNFKKIGCELFVNTHTKFNTQIASNKRELLVEKAKKNCPTVFDVESNAEEVCTGLFEDFLSFKIAQDELMKIYKQNDLLLDELVTQLIPIPQIKFYRIDFVSITEKALNIKIP